MRPVTIYVLFSTRDGAIRYVGQTHQAPAQRLVQHRNYAKLRKKTAVHKWFNRETADGFEVRIAPIKEHALLHEDEISLIAKYRQAGFRLLNLTDGGEGTSGWHGNKGNKRPDLSERNRLNAGKPTGRRMSEENKAKLIEAIRGSKRPWLSERNRAGLWRGKKHTEESKQKIRAAHLGKPKSPEHIENMKIAQRKWREAKRAAASI